MTKHHSRRVSVGTIALTRLLVPTLLGLPSVGWETTPSIPTYTHDIAPILSQHCVRCHRADGAMPDLPLTTYRSAASKLHAIRDKVSRREMPPWPADAAASLAFSNDPRLDPQDIAKIEAWIDAGAPQGDAAQLPAAPEFVSGWSHPEGRAPDAIVTLPRFTLAANGTIPYQERLIKLPFKEDHWVSAIEVRAGNPRILHHMGITEVRLPEGMTPENLSALDTIAEHVGAQSGRLLVEKPAVEDPHVAGSYDMFGVYTPGTTFESYGAGNGKLLKGGGNLYLNFNIHYTTTGREETDVSHLALWFEPRAPSHLLIRAPSGVAAISANGRQLLTDDPGTKAEGTVYALPPIGPNDSSYELVGMTAFTHAVTIYQLQPHAHVRARDFFYGIVYPDGREIAVLSVPRYRYHFQLAYSLAKPLDVPAGSKLVVVAHYDNSKGNPELEHLGSNMAAQRCGPDNVAYFGQQNQSWDEMFSPFIQYSDAAGRATSVKELDLVTAVGCLVDTPHGWMLSHAAAARTAVAQGLSSSELAAAAKTPSGALRYRLLGVDRFSPGAQTGGRVAVNGVLIPGHGGSAINVSSLYPTASTCR